MVLDLSAGRLISPGYFTPISAGLAAQDDYPAMRLLADRLGRNIGVVTQREVDPPALERGHWLELEHFAAFGDLLGRPCRDLAQLALAPAAVILDIDQYARPGAQLTRQHQVDQVLQRRQALTLAADERAQGFLAAFVAAHIELRGVAGLDADLDREAHVVEQLLEDRA